MDGIAIQSIARLTPINDVMKTNKNEPKIMPTGGRDPTHETCSFVKGPSSSGVFWEINVERAGETQPKMIHACVPLNHMLERTHVKIDILTN